MDCSRVRMLMIMYKHTMYELCLFSVEKAGGRKLGRARKKSVFEVQAAELGTGTSGKERGQEGGSRSRQDR